MRVCLFEDGHVGDLDPLTLTRPAFDLLCGLASLARKQCGYFAPDPKTGFLVRAHLEATQREKHPACAVNDARWLQSGTMVLVNGRWLPPTGPAPDYPALGVGLVGDEVAYAVVGPEQLAGCSPETIDDCLYRWKQSLPHRPAGGMLFRHLWEIVDQNGPQITADFAARADKLAAGVGPGLAVVGPRERVRIDPTATVDPMVVVDTTGGPVVIDAGAVIGAFTRIEGPCYVGPHTHLLGAKLRAGTTLGPACRIGGEVEASIIQGYSNKYHEGFLGHSYVGEWVNLGAGTHNSDLRNDYGPVTVTVAGRRVQTSRAKVGCYLGDHTKSGLGSLLNTGTSVGAFCGLLPCGGFLPKYVPSFCDVWNGRLVENDGPTSLLDTAAKVMSRRGLTLTESRAELYRRVATATAAERHQAVRESEQRRLRKSA